MITAQRYNILRSAEGIFFLILLLYFGRKLFIPLCFALLISLILYPMTHWLEEKGWPKLLAILTSLSALVLILVGLTFLLVYQFSEFLQHWPEMQKKLELVLAQTVSNIGAGLGISDLERQDWINTLVNNGVEYVLNRLPRSLYITSVNLVLLLLVPFYVILILFYSRQLFGFLYRITGQWSYDTFKNMLNDSIHTYFEFIKGVSLVYLIVGILNSVGLALLGIPNAVLFGFIASILTFIPYVGITIGALLPVAVAWLTYDSVLYPLGVVAVFVFVQVLEANVIFPLVVSRHLKINALAAIIVIIAGGLIWGAAGMILFLPFVAIFKLVLNHIDKDHPVAILLEP